MKYFEKNMGKENVTLTGYLHEVSRELKNTDVRPAVLIFPGGGYFMCSDREGEPIALAYMAEGYQAFVLRYSVGGDISFSESFEDGTAALRYLKEHASELHIDPGKIVIAGFSAGGHMAACMGTISEVKPAAMILGYPAILGYMGKVLGKEFPELEDSIAADTPPAFIFSTSTDMIVPVENSLKFAEALDKNNVEFELHIYRNGPHGLSLAKALTSNGQKNMVNLRAAGWFTESIGWLKEIFGDFEAEETDELAMQKSGISIDTPVRMLVKDDECRKILLAFIPDFMEMLRKNPMSGEFSLHIMNQFSPEIITDEMLSEIKIEMEKLLSAERNK